MLESDFLNVCFFPVSAMGHSDCEEEFEPWGVLQPFFWLVDSEKCPLYEIINSTKEEK